LFELFRFFLGSSPEWVNKKKRNTIRQNPNCCGIRFFGWCVSGPGSLSGSGFFLLGSSCRRRCAAALAGEVCSPRQVGSMGEGKKPRSSPQLFIKNKRPPPIYFFVGENISWPVTVQLYHNSEVISIKKVKFINREQAELVYSRLPRSSRLIFAIGLETGLRISDILRLKWRDVANPMQVYISRTKEIRSFPLSDRLYNALISYANNDQPEKYIFASSRKRRRSISRTTYHRHIKRALEMLPFDCSAHSSRKFYLWNVTECNNKNSKTNAF